MKRSTLKYYKKIFAAVVSSLFILLTAGGCSKEIFLRETESITLPRESASTEAEKNTETAASKEETAETEAESREEESEDPSDEQTYVASVELKKYNISAIAEYLLGSNYEVEKHADSVTGAESAIYRKGTGRLEAIGEGQFCYDPKGIGELYRAVVEYCYDAVFAYQSAHLENLFSTDPAAAPGYETAKDKSDELAERIAFDFDSTESYFLDYEFLAEKMLWSPGPEFYAEFGYDMLGDEDTQYWQENETAFCFLYRKNKIDGLTLGTNYRENVLVIVYSPSYGVTYVSCPPSLSVIEKSETPVKSAEEVYDEYRMLLANYAIAEADVELVSTEIVYSAYDSLMKESADVQLKPYWKFTFRSLITDAELETIMFGGENCFSSQNKSEYYVLVSALEESE